MPSNRWSPELLDTVIEYMQSGLPLAHIAEIKGMPSVDTMQRWIDAGDEFAVRIAHARDMGWDKRAADAVRDAKTAEDAAKGRLAFDAERWLLAKMKPRTYGDKLAVGGADDLPAIKNEAIGLADIVAQLATATGADPDQALRLLAKQDVPTAH